MIETNLQSQIEAELSGLPLVQYAWLDPDDIVFAREARLICQQECPRYGKSWSCPPGVGTVEQCRQQCSEYEGVFVFTTIVEVRDIMNMEETLRTRRDHEAVTRGVQAVFRQYYEETLPLSGESCELCETCAYPDAPCRHPEHQISCVEGYGIVVPSLAEKAGLEFDNGYNIVTWFGMVLFRQRKQDLS